MFPEYSGFNSFKQIHNPQYTIFQYQNTHQTMLHPIITWAQRKDKVFLQIPLRDVKDQKIQLKENTIQFEGMSDSKKYQFSIQLFDSINSQDSKWNKTGFHILVALQKKQTDKPFWPRLTKDSVKNQYIKVDWSKWVDQDQQQEEGDKGLQGFDPSMMQGFPGGMGGMGDMGGFGADDQDDENEQQRNLDDLDKPEQIMEKQSA